MHTYGHMHACMVAYTYTHSRCLLYFSGRYIHTYTQTYIHIYTHTCTQVADRPVGLRSCLLSHFQALDQTDMDRVHEPEWLSLVFSVTFLHSIIMTRLRYGHVGWSVPFDLRYRDLKACFEYLEMLLKSSDARTQTGRLVVPWSNIQQVSFFLLVCVCMYVVHVYVPGDLRPVYIHTHTHTQSMEMYRRYTYTYT